MRGGLGRLPVHVGRRRLTRDSVILSWLVLGLLSAPCAFAAAGPQVGECVLLRAKSDLGVPLHPEAGNPGVSGRVPGGRIGRVTALDQPTGWLRIEAEDTAGWITPKYVEAVVECPSQGDAVATDDSCVVGTWNLEWFTADKSRGFPENGQGGPTYPPRTEQDLAAIAAIIEQLEVRILLLQEIGADAAGGGSELLDRLVGILGPANFGYEVGTSGGDQHLAILYDKRATRLNAVCEGALANKTVQDGQLFARQPLFAHFTLLADGQARNDLLVVDVHLASGQDKTRNHDEAMKALRAYLDDAPVDDSCRPTGEEDLLIAGDFNASRFDQKNEKFWDEMEDDGWDVLADDPAEYPPTRLAGHPLTPKSTIDYIVVTKSDGALVPETGGVEALVHSELINAPVAFRSCCSDHVPVTVRVPLGTDDD